MAAAGLALLLASAVRAVDGDASGLALAARALQGNPRCVLLQGSTAYVGLDSGLAVVDVSDPAAPSVLAHLALPSPVLDLASTPGALLAAAGESGLIAIDVAVPSAPAVTGSAALPGARCVATSGTTAYVGRDLAGSFGVSVVDASGPTPSETGFAATANGVNDIEVSGTTAWAGLGSDAAQLSGLQAVDAASPSSPSLSGFLATTRPVNGIALSGSTAYLATGIALRGDLVVANVASAASPSEVSRTTFGDSARGIALDGSVALIAASRLGLMRYDVGNPAAPARLDALPTGRDSVGVAAAPGLALVADRSSTGIAGLDVVDAPAPPLVTSLTAVVPFAEATDVALDAGIVHALRRDGLHELDTAAGLAEAGLFTLPAADFSALAVEAGLAAIAEGPAVHLVDVTDPTAPSQQGTLVVPVGVAADLALLARTLYVATGRSVEIYDVSAPAAPVALGAWDSAEQDAAIAVDGTVAVTGGGTLVRLLDVGVPGVPLGLGSVTISDQVQSLAMSRGIVAAGGLTTTTFIDATDPSAPAVVGQVPGGADDVVIASGFAFLASGSAGVRVVDIGDPALPVEVAYFDASGEATGVAADGVSIALATSSSQVWWFDCAACAAGCLARASLTGPSPACTGRPLVFDASASALSGCAGAPAYRWFVDGAEVPGAVAATFDAAPLVAGTHVVEAEVSCDADPGCADVASALVDVVADSFPVLDPASLRVRKVTGGEELSWVVVSGSGEVNVHRSVVARDLADAAITPATVVSVATGTTDLNTFSPGLGACAFFKVFGRSSCDGSSLVP